MEKAQFLGLPLSASADEEKIISSINRAWSENLPLLITFINPHAWTLIRHNHEYKEYLTQMDQVLPDGIAVAKVASFLLRQEVRRHSFDASSLYHPVFSLLNEQSRSLFIAGGAPGVAQAAFDRMARTYPSIRLKGLSDGFRAQETLVSEIMECQPDFVLCGMGAPHQEKLLLALKAAGFRGCAFTCGGFLDQLALSENYYPAWIDRFELRWLWRIWKEPKRLWRRYAIEYLPFIAQSLLSAIRLRPSPH